MLLDRWTEAEPNVMAWGQSAVGTIALDAVADLIAGRFRL
jgi:hypothetical protein